MGEGIWRHLELKGGGDVRAVAYQRGAFVQKFGKSHLRGPEGGGEGCLGLSRNALVWEGGLSPFPPHWSKYSVPLLQHGVRAGGQVR